MWEHFVFLVIFDTCDVVYNCSISLLPPIVLDNLFASLYTWYYHLLVRNVPINITLYVNYKQAPAWTEEAWEGEAEEGTGSKCPEEGCSEEEEQREGPGRDENSWTGTNREGKESCQGLAGRKRRKGSVFFSHFYIFLVFSVFFFDA